MIVPFVKYQATGNDFVVLDNRNGDIQLSLDQIKKLCDRKFGVGADGLMLIEKDPDLDFHLQYYNSDGSQSLCGNGSRAAVHFASQLGVINGKATFNAFDGAHDAQIVDGGIIRLKMNDVAGLKEQPDGIFVDTGSPHLIQFVSDVQAFDVLEKGRAIRFSDAYKPAGTNVNFVEQLDDHTLFVRTYERGVENETLSCGTGVTAAALASTSRSLHSPVNIKTKGGNLTVEFKISQSGTFTDIFLSGPAKMVFRGELEL